MFSMFMDANSECSLLVVKHDETAVNGSLFKDLITIDPKTGLDLYPHWLAQPYFRPLPPPVVNKKNVEGSKQSAGLGL